MREPPEEITIRVVVNMCGGEIGWPGVEPCCCWTIAMSIAAVASCTMRLEQGLSLSHGLWGGGHGIFEIGGGISIHEDDA